MASRPNASRARALQPVGSHDPLYAAAADAFAHARFDLADVLLRSTTPVSKAQSGRLRLLEARLARISYDFERWYEAAGEARFALTEPSERLTALVLRAIAAKRLGKDDEAKQLLADAERRLARADPSTVGLANYLIALDAWEAGDLEKAERLARRNIAAGADAAESIGLIAWIEIRRERFEAAGATYVAAIDRLAASGETDVRLHARLVHSAAIVASETADLALGERLRAEYDAVAWTASLADARFDTLQCLRFLALLRGDLADASILARDAIAYATREAFVAIGETNAAVTSRLLGDERAWRIQLERAWDVLRSTSWRAADDDARIALTNFAIEATESMPAEARQAVTIYQSLQVKPNPLSGFSGRDRRIDAYESVAAARVAEILGDRELAVREYGRALDVWVDIGFHMRAALAALDLRRLTGSPAYDAPVEAALLRAPNAWFAPLRETSVSPVHALTPAERTVLLGLLAGKSAKAIAAALGRSHFTINNHTRKIFTAFGVNSRARLLARCVELGVTVATVERQL